ncbi:coagulase domain-containing protein [Staphylococcus hyicus]|uniref:coagulase domain-containing protein n=1 Tax=Staphylococcus hyicus TaxID=1284 RepID=UPI0036D34ADE
MKKKLLVLSASAILASNFIFDNNASAVVSKNEYTSKSWEVGGKINPDISLDRYENHLEDLVLSQSLGRFSGYDQPEYNEVFKKYQNRFLEEAYAYKQFLLEEKAMADSNSDYLSPYKKNKSYKMLGLTHQRYQSIYDEIKQNKKDFEEDVKKIEDNNPDLKRFNDQEKYNAYRQVEELEHKVLMVAATFNENIDARENLYNKLDIIMGYKEDKDGYKIPLNIPQNKRMLSDIKEDLETIIDEFFDEIGSKRPKDIPMLTTQNKNSSEVRNKLKEAAEKAKTDESYRDSNVEIRAKKAKERLDKITENSRKAKAASKPLKSYKKDPKAFPHKQLRNELSIKFPESSPEFPIYTVATESQPQPVLKQQTKEEKVDVLKSKRPETTLNGLNGESNLVTIDESSNASTQFGSNAHVFEYSFDSTPKTTNIAKQNVKQENYNSVNNLAGMSGESQHVDFTQDSNPSTTYGGYGNAFDFTEDTAPKQPETITESHEIVLDYQTHATMSGFKTGVSTEAYYSSNELTK